MTRVTICSAVWRRHALTRIWWSGVRRICRRFAEHGIDATVTVTGSEPRHARLARQHGATWVRVANAPLGRKWNAAVERACEDGADYILILGSDDFLADALVDRYAQLIADGWLYVGLAGIYFLEPSSGSMVRYQMRTGRHGAPIGAGRLVHTRLLEREGFRPWLDGRERALDANMTARCDMPAAKLIRATPTLAALDVKTETNVTPFGRLREAYPRLHLIPGPLAAIPEWARLARLTA